MISKTLTIDSKNKIDELTSNLVETISPQKFRPIDVYKITKNIGAKVILIKNKTNKKGFVSLKKKNGTFNEIECYFGVNPFLCSKENREVIANEIAHLFIDKKDGEKVYLYEYNNNSNDSFVDYFASSILLPRKDFIELYMTLKDKCDVKEDKIIEQISSFYDVETNIVEKRIEDLRYVL